MLLLLLPALAHAQVKVVKRTCSYDKKFIGAKLVVQYRQGDVLLESDLEYWLNSFIDLPDSAKIKVVEKLLDFTNDLSLCCLAVITRSFNGVEGCAGKPRGAIRYPLQVDALYMINRICWPKLMEQISCAPVLFDYQSQQCINMSPKKVKEVVLRYKLWFASCKASGKIDREFPLSSGRYGWYSRR